MKITPQVLYQRIKGSLSEALHLDLSGLGIGAIEGLENCPKLESLDLSRNCLEDFENYDCCKNLWRINLSDNKISCLNNLSKMFAIGTLDLSFNDVCWDELLRIRHIFILDLRLYGNELLEKDTYYRMHVIDCLPNVWLLDGRLITSAERVQVRQFFEDSALSHRPVRHKLKEKSFLCCKLPKSVEIYGERTYQFSSQFPINEAHTCDTDKRRLEFLAHNIQEDLKKRKESTKRTFHCITNNSLQMIIEKRHLDKEKCNMLLLLLVASMEFDLPESLIKDTLKVTKLNPLFGANTFQLFQLDVRSRTEIVSLLVSSCKLDREVDKPSCGGLYDRLYLCLYHSVAHLLQRVCRGRRKSCWVDRSLKGSRPSTAAVHYRPHQFDAKPFMTKKNIPNWKTHQTLLASELVLLLSVVPSFYQHILVNDQSVYSLLLIATGDEELFKRLSGWSEKIMSEGGDLNSMCTEICKSVIKRMEEGNEMRASYFDTEADKFRRWRKAHEKTQSDFILSTSEAYPKRPRSAVLVSGERLTTAKKFQKSWDHSSITQFYDLPKLTLGSYILLGPQNLARVIALPEPLVALVQMDLIPALNGSVRVHAKDLDEHYCYVDIRQLTYDHTCRYWKPRGAVGDKVTLQMDDDNEVSSVAEQKSLIYGSETTTSSLLRKELVYSSGKSQKLRAKRPSAPQSSHRVSPVSSLNVTSPDMSRFDDDRDHSGSFVPDARPLSTIYCERLELTLPGIKVQALGARKVAADTDAPKHSNRESNASPLSPRTMDSPAPPASYDESLPEVEEEEQWNAGSEPKDDTVDDFIEQQRGSTTIDSSYLDDAQNEQTLLMEDEGEKIVQDDSSASPLLSFRMPEQDIDQESADVEAELEQQLQGATLDEDVDPGVDANEEQGKEMESSQADKGRSEPLEGSRQELEEPEQEKQRSGEKKPRVKSAPDIKTKSIRSPPSRPVSAAAPKKVLFFRDQSANDDSRPGSASSFQMMRTEAWRSSASSASTGFPTSANAALKFTHFVVDSRQLPKAPEVKFTLKMKRPPPQRPTSPNQTSSVVGGADQRRPYSPLKSPSLIRESDGGPSVSTSHWLADGRDLHTEDLRYRQRFLTSKVPGYLDTPYLPANLMKKKSYISKGKFGIEMLPPRPVKPSALHPTTHQRRSMSSARSSRDYRPPSQSLSGFSRPRFSTLGDIKRLSSIPGYFNRPFYG